MSELQKEIAFTFVLRLPCLISFLLFFYGVIKIVYNIINHFICKIKYRNLIKHHMDVCLRCENRLQEDVQFRREILTKKIKSLYLG